MMRRLTLLFTLFFCFCYMISAQIVPVGSGSYTKTFPGTDEAGRNGFPRTAPLVSGVAATKPIPTNDWWSSVLKNDIFGGTNAFAENLFSYPIAMQTSTSGLVVSYIPFGVFDDQDPIIVGVSGLNADKSTTSDFSDWTVTMNWDDKFQATAGIGMPFVYFNKKQSEVASITINLGTVSVSGEMMTITDARNGADFAIYAPVGSTWTQSGTTYTSTLNGKNYWSLAMLPQTQSDVEGIAAAYKKYAYVFPSNTLVNWKFDEAKSVMRTEFIVETDVKEGTETNVLMGLLPHQWDHLAADSPVPQEFVYNSVRGDIKTLNGNKFIVENTYHGILPTLPYLTNYSDGFDLSALDEKVKLLENDQLATWTDSYNEGQVMNRLIQTARIAHEMGNTASRDKMLATIKERLEDWLTAEGGEVAFLFYYNADWSAMLGYPAGHGQDTNINDHHFHWGYFIHAAAFLEQFQPGWAKDWGDMINLLVRDASSPDRADELFPFLRNFSPYAGHCWANGMAAFPQGNDQESTSESMQFNSSLIHWGTITGNDEIRDLGIYLYTTEQSAVEEYWFDIDERIFPDNQYSLVSRVWGNSYDNGTFWTNDIEASYGIELYPIHAGSMYLGHNIPYAEKLWAEIEGNTGILNNDDNVNLWHDTMWKYLSFTDAQKAIELYDAYPDRNLKFGVSDAQTYYWLHSMNAMGQIDISITADYPIAVAFNKDGEYTYVAHNYNKEDINVTFSDGYVLAVPANAMATNRDIDISGEISSSFDRAYPGGSVALTVATQGSTPTKVEFYDNGALIGEDLSEPFTFKATSLSARVHGFYAKIFIGDDFGVTNIASVTVGEQLPFRSLNAIPGVIEAGHYDIYEGGKGQGIAYSDVSPNNEGDYRIDEAVDVGLSDVEGAFVGWISGGEWVEYSIDVSQSGLYDLSVRYASGNQNGGGPFHFEIDGQRINDDISLNSTSEWDGWQTATATGIAFPEGAHVLRLVFDKGEFNIGRMTFSFKAELPYSQPVANAGANVVVLMPETTASLNGALSTDPDNDPLTFSWEQIYGPSDIAFSDKTVDSPQISNLEEGIYLCRLSVTDGQYSATDEVLIIVSESGNSSPTVSITSPANNASFQEGESISISANATDLEGSVTKVEFFDGSTKLGEDTSAPFAVTYSSPSIGEHELKAIATDEQGATGESAIVKVLVSEVQSCEKTSSEALEGAFSVGYKATFESVGSNVMVTIALLDTDKSGVIAYLREETPFTEVQMDNVSGNIFTKTLSNRTVGADLRIGFKFAFAGGLATTKYFDYQVGENCNGSNGEDTAPPTNFTAVVGAVTASSVEIILNAKDDSGKVVYEVIYGTSTKTTTADSEVEKSFVISGLTSETDYSFSVVAKDLAGNAAENNPIALTAKTTVNTSTDCSGNGSDAQQGTFDVGFIYSFETAGTDVAISFELLDQKADVIAYLWQESPFAETAMTKVSERKFKTTLTGQNLGSTISVACKFAFAGGLAVTAYLPYKVGDDCSTEEDTSPPTSFTASIGSITSNAVELLLNASDDASTIFYRIVSGENTFTTSATSGVEHPYIIEDLIAKTTYSFSISAMDASDNLADNSPIVLEATTAEKQEDTAAPTGFTAQVGNITTSTVELLLNATDDSGEIIYRIAFEDTVDTLFSVTSGVEKSYISQNLMPTTTYSFSITAMDEAGNLAANNPLVIEATTMEETQEDTTAPTDFTAVVGNVTASSVELLLNASDDSGEVTYHIDFDGKSNTTTALSGVEKSYVVTDLVAATNYTFSLKVMDSYENFAVSNPLILVATEKLPLHVVEELSEKLTYFPNPVTDLFTINWRSFKSMTVYTLDGSAVLRSEEPIVSFLKLKKGVYLVTVTGSDNQLQHFKVLKQ